MTNNAADHTEQILSKIPVINEDLNFEVNEGIVTVKKEQAHKIQKVLRKLGADIPQESKLELDEYSSTVFLNINGENSIYDLGVIMEDIYGEEIKPVYERLLVLVEHFVYQRKWAHYIDQE